MYNLSYLEVPHDRGDTKLKDAMYITAEPLYKSIEISFSQLHRMFLSDYRQISPFSFAKKTKISDNWNNSMQNLIILDIDDGITIQTAKDVFKRYKYFAYTTKSHQVEKKGLKTDRFRIILSAINIPGGDIYFEYMKNMEIIYPFIDKQVNTKTGAFLGNADGEYWYNDGEDFNMQNFKPIQQLQKNISSPTPRTDLPIDIIKQSLDQEVVSQIVESCGYEVNRNFKFKFRQDERTPSASIRKDGYIKDFGSDLSTDAIGFVQEVKGVNFTEAVAIVGGFVNIKIVA